MTEKESPAARLQPEVVEIPMRDGVRLVGDVYRPGGQPGPWPVLLAMTPYGRRNLGPYLAGVCVPHGYALLAVDVRGRYDSGGVFGPVIQERRDAPDLMAWLEAQSWLDRRAGVGTIGLSYLATAGFLAAAGNPLVKAATSITVVVDLDTTGYRGGVLDLHHAFPWCVITGGSPQPDLRQWNWRELFAHLPLATMDKAAGLDLPVWRRLLAAAGGPGRLAGGRGEGGFGAEGPETGGQKEGVPSRGRRGANPGARSPADAPADDPGTDISADLARCLAPVLHLGGWYDFILGESLRAYDILCRAAHAQQSLVLGPWNHTTIMSGETSMGGVDFGPESTSDLPARLLRWFDYWLRGKGSRPEQVEAFVTGGGGWLRPAGWPPPADRYQELRLYLDGSPAGGADLAIPKDAMESGRVRSLAARQRGEETLEYTYDPADPTPTLGGAVWPFRIAGLEPGPADQRPLLDRPDGLFFLTPALETDLVALGPVRFRLTAATDAPDTDFVVRLLDVEPGGAWRIIQDGIARVRFRQDPAGPAGGDRHAGGGGSTGRGESIEARWAGPARWRLVQPGETFTLDVDCWAVGHRFAAGHRIGVHLAGASFPKYARNLNTGGDPAWETVPRRARHSIRTGLSYLSLTVRG